MQMTFHRKLPIPQDVKKEFPVTKRMEQIKADLVALDGKYDADYEAIVGEE